MVVAVTVCRPGEKQTTLVCCINVTTQPQELRAGNLLGILRPPEDRQIQKGRRVGQCVGIHDKQGTDKCPQNITTLLSQVIRI